MPPHRLSDLNIQQLDTRLCLLGFLSLCLTIEMRLLTRLCKITMINEICTYFLSCNIPTILLIQSVRCACVISTYIMYALPTSPKSGTSKWPMQEQPIYFFCGVQFVHVQLGNTPWPRESKRPCNPINFQRCLDDWGELQSRRHRAVVEWATCLTFGWVYFHLQGYPKAQKS